ncbi:MAG: LrgB family protein [Clostridia bacterium]|nr:LrgB family protein [Clostridia bacterium]
MSEFLGMSTYFGFVISICAYVIGIQLNKKFKLAVLNPLLIAIIITIAVLLAGNISYEEYNAGAKYITYLLTPATVALAVPLYDKLKILKNNFKAITLGIVSGIITSFVTNLIICVFFKLSHEQYITLLPKSITTAIGMELSAEFGGSRTITTAVIVITGIAGSVMGEKIFKLLNIKNPIAKGVALGSASHAIGTSKAVELGETEGAMAGLSIAVSGILTVIAMNIFTLFY